MPSILIIDKTGVLKSLNVKTPSNDELYKKAGFKTNTDFSRQTTWHVELHGTRYSISLYAKKSGLAKQENKYEFPPPVDKALYFGSCVLVRHEREDTESWKDISVSDWEKIYDHLYGGFEDIGSDDSDEDSIEDDSMHALEKTKTGYAKDDFIVEDDEESEESIPVKKLKKQKTQQQQVVSATTADTATVLASATACAKDEKEDDFLDCTSELSEEEYIE